MGVIKIVPLTTLEIMAQGQMKNEGLGMVKIPQIKFVKIATGKGTHKKGAGLRGVLIINAIKQMWKKTLKNWILQKVKSK